VNLIVWPIFADPPHELDRLNLGQPDIFQAHDEAVVRDVAHQFHPEILQLFSPLRLDLALKLDEEESGGDWSVGLTGSGPAKSGGRSNNRFVSQLDEFGLGLG
jgi:hypothetical protein